MESLNRPENCLCANLRSKARRVSRIYDDALSPAGLNVQQFTALITLSKLGPTTTSELAQALDLERTVVTRNMSVLAKAGLVDRQEGEDRRERIIALTPGAHRKITEAYPLWQAAQKKLTDQLGGPASHALLEQLSHL